MTIDAALALVRAGFVPEDASVELLDGELSYVDRSADGGEMESRDHRLTVLLLGKLSTRIDSPARHVATQATLVCDAEHAPVPDAAVLKGTPRDYDEIPPASAAFSIVEVAESSYRKDAKEKLAIYARAGVPQYVIVNLNDRTAEVHTQPDAANGRYGAKATIAADGVLGLRVGDAETFDVPLADVLP